MGSTTLVTTAQRDAWVDEVGLGLAFTDVLLRTDGTDPAVVASAVADELPRTTVRTGEEYAQQMLQDLTGQAYMLTAVILGFGALAMFVAAIVITNTFHVLVAQRTHTLALLRAVGATKRQIRRSVLTEALILGVVAGAGGLLLGAGLGQGALWVLGAQNLPFPVPESITLTPAAVVVPLLTGAIVTVLAALSPARAATVVSPLAALRPPQPPDPRGASRLRLVATFVLVLGGGAMVAAAPFLAGSESIDDETAVLGALALGIGGGVVSFAGVMLGMVFVVPTVVRVLGAVARRVGGGTPARIATANAVRNPRRTAATATALVIGVTLVALMSTGAVSARASLDSMLRSQFPVDLVVSSSSWDPDTGLPLGLSDEQIETVELTENVDRTLGVHEAWPTFTTPDGEIEAEVSLVDPDAAADVMHDPSQLDGLADDTLLAGSAWTRWTGLDDGDTVTMGDAELTVVVAGTGSTAYATLAQREAIDPEAPVGELWVRLTGDDQAATITAVSDRLTEAQAAATEDDPEGRYDTPYVDGPAAQRQIFEQVISPVLASVDGLLGEIGRASCRERVYVRARGGSRAQVRHHDYFV